MNIKFNLRIAIVLLIAYINLHNYIFAQSGNIDNDGRYVASFKEFPLGAKALALGGAFTALANDGTAFYWNPAGVALIENKLLSGMYSSQYGSIGTPLAGYYFAGWTMPVGSLNLSINWMRLAVTDIPYYDDLSKIQTATERYKRIKGMEPPETFSDNEDLFSLSIAKNINPALNFGWSLNRVPIEIPVGANLKWIRQSLADNKANGIGIDLGLLVKINMQDIVLSDDWPVITGGVCIKDVGGSSLYWEQTKQQEEIKSVTNYGFSYKQPLRKQELNITASYEHSGLYGGENHFGLEAEYRKQFSFRLGLNSGTFTAGAGVNFNFFDVDYAYLAPSTQQLGNVHRISVAFNFDKLIEGKKLPPAGGMNTP